MIITRNKHIVLRIEFMVAKLVTLKTAISGRGLDFRCHKYINIFAVLTLQYTNEYHLGYMH